ncbi:hypothetical protein XpiCFBP4643_18945 [Xanthomonas pisi]|uniref:Uncharacterized protein n=1 Tax=Xanthomonas pisi TaxID=56457 RepID=A0A2S7CXX4_9XANT|nr:hypothetical protein XpiCFBP4643_18945 [Xanthomonas pisi]
MRWGVQLHAWPMLREQGARESAISALGCRGCGDDLVPIAGLPRTGARPVIHCDRRKARAVSRLASEE